jgi:hypothetical protein
VLRRRFGHRPWLVAGYVLPVQGAGMIDTPSLLIGALLGFLAGLAMNRRPGNVTVTIQHNISQGPEEEIEDDPADRWKDGRGPPGFSDN